MKKILLLLLMLCYHSLFSQINTNVSNYIVCDGNNDGFATFDLTSKIPEILANENPATHTITFHTSLAAAQNMSNPIANPTAFMNSMSNQVIYVNVLNSTTSESVVTSFVLVVATSNAGTDGNATVCDSSLSTINLFSLITGEQPGGIWVRTAGTGGTFNAIAGTFTPAVGATTSAFQYTVSATPPCTNDSSTVVITINNCNFPVCGGTFTDNGGANGNYTNNAAQTTTICPSNPGQMVTITFTSFSIEAGQDALYVYNGNSPFAGQIASGNPGANVPGGLAGGFWGTTIPGPFTSSSPDGCLTFVFRSDNSGTQAGWVANVDCTIIECEPPINLNVTNLTNTSAVINWTNVGSAVVWEVLALPYGSPAPTASTTGFMYSQSNPYVITGLTPDQCYSVYVRSSCVPGAPITASWSQPVSFCMYDCENNGQCAESLSLIAFLDVNSNGTKDSGEPLFNNGGFTYTINSGTPLYGNSNTGSFSIYENNPANTYEMGFAVSNGISQYFTSSTTYSNITVPTGSGTTTYYFPVVQVQPYNDLEIHVIPTQNPRPGFNYINTIVYRNKGFQNVASGTVTFTRNPSVSITAISEAGTTTLPSGFSHNFTNLGPNETRIITVTMAVPTIPTVNLNDILTNSASIEPISGDSNPLDNSDSLSQIVVGSYDPNDKMEAHGGRIDVVYFTPNDYLTYTIRFENTGTANAEFIRVEDELDALLNAGSVEVLNASHAYNFRRIDNKLIWNFYNIDLPPTIANPTLSHGHVQFRVKPNAGYVAGTIIPNSGEIYFDYNPPIFTGTFNTEFVESLGNASFDASNFMLFPNPANDSVQIHLQDTMERIENIIVYDMIGKTMKSANHINSNETQLSVSDLSKGMYLIEITTGNGRKQTKKLVIK